MWQNCLSKGKDNHPVVQHGRFLYAIVTRRNLSRMPVNDSIPTHDLLEEEDVAGGSQWL